MTILETNRLLLRRLSTEDSPFILQLLNEPSFLHNIGDKGVKTLDDAAQYLQRGPIESYGRLGYGLYLVELKCTKTAIGICGLVKRETLEDADIGFAFLPAFWTKGYAVESSLAVLNYARNGLGLKRILGVTSPNNQGSIRVLEKIGLRYERMVKLSLESPEVKLFVCLL